MIATKPETPSSIQYPRRTVERADLAMRRSPFTWQLFSTMRSQSVPLGAIAGNAGGQNQYTRQPLAELTAENDLLWLIEVGLLRREVDGQGLTDKFRLTPLGRQLVEKWENLGSVWPAPTLREILINFARRWLRLPI